MLCVGHCTRYDEYGGKEQGVTSCFKINVACECVMLRCFIATVAEQLWVIFRAVLRVTRYLSLFKWGSVP